MKIDGIDTQLRRYEQDSVWLHRRFDRLRKKYPDEFVAVFKRKIVAHAPTIAQLHAGIRRHSPEALGNAAVEFLPKDDLQLIL